MFPDAGPTARALLALELVRARPGITASELAGRLEVSDRAARRTITTLRDAGVPIESVRGPHGGYRLGRGLRLPPLVFTATEALGLVMAVLDGQHAASDGLDPVGSTLGKIIGALPETVGRQAALMREHAAPAPSRVAARPDPDTTSALVAAVAAQRRVPITYARPGGEAWGEDVDPWAVVVRYGRWYLLCFSHRASVVRTYRVDRVASVGEQGARFDPPADLDAVATLEEHLGTGWAHVVRVEFDAPLAEVAHWVGPAMGRLSPLPGGGCVLEGSTNNAEAYAGEWLAAIPFAFRVVEGAELRDAVSRLAERFAAAVTNEHELTPGSWSVRQPPSRSESALSQEDGT